MLLNYELSFTTVHTSHSFSHSLQILWSCCFVQFQTKCWNQNNSRAVLHGVHFSCDFKRQQICKTLSGISIKFLTWHKTNLPKSSVLRSFSPYPCCPCSSPCQPPCPSSSSPWTPPSTASRPRLCRSGQKQQSPWVGSNMADLKYLFRNSFQSILILLCMEFCFVHF